MQNPRFRRNRLKLLISAVVLSGVLVFAAVAQKRHTATDPFAPEQTRARSAESSRPLYGEDRRPDPRSTELPLPERTPEPIQAEGQTGEGQTDRSSVPADVLGFLERWKSTLVNGRVDEHSDLYARRVDRFFRQRGVSREQVRREKQQMVQRFPNFKKYEISDVRLESRKGDRAVVTFRKEWDASGQGRFAGAERQRLTLRRAGPAWQITGEEELKVFWVRRG